MSQSAARGLGGAALRQPRFPHQSTEGLRVLAVDDNQDAADSMCWLLHSLGANAEAVYDGESALRRIRAWHPHVVFLDVHMPGMDGLQVASQVRADPAFDDVVLIALSGAGLEDDRLRSQRAGFDRHVVKPVDIRELEAVLASLT